MRLCSKQTVLVVFGILIVFLAISVGIAREYIINMVPKKDGFQVQAKSSVNPLVGIKNVLIVGGTNGLGKALAEALLKRGNINVTVIGRTTPAELLRTFKSNVRFESVDLSSMKSARKLADLLKDEKFDALVFTNSISPLKLERTPEGIESDLAVSYLSRHVIINTFIANGYDKIKLASGNKPRVFLMGAPGFDLTPALDDVNWEHSFSAIPAHMNTHIFNEAIVHHYTKKYPSIEFFGLNPGMIVTGGLGKVIGNPQITAVIGRILGLLFSSAEDYAEHVLVQLLAHPDIKSGSLFNQRGSEIVPNPWFNTEDRAGQLIAINDDLLRKYNL